MVRTDNISWNGWECKPGNRLFHTARALRRRSAHAVYIGYADCIYYDSSLPDCAETRDPGTTENIYPDASQRAFLAENLEKIWSGVGDRSVLSAVWGAGRGGMGRGVGPLGNGWMRREVVAQFGQAPLAIQVAQAS